MKRVGPTPDQIEAVLQGAGINPTAQRIAICQYVLRDADHPTAEDVKHWVDQHFPKLSLATVYNTLRILVASGLLREMKLPHMERAIYDNNTADHYHFLDEVTGEIVDIPCDSLKLVSKLDPSFRIDSVEVLVRGTRG